MSSSSKSPRDYSQKYQRAILEPWRQSHGLPPSPPSLPNRTTPTSPISNNSLSYSSPLQNSNQNLNEIHYLSNLLDINLQQAIKATNPSPPTSPYIPPPFLDQEQASVEVKEGCNSVQKETRSEDPFNIYYLLDKKKCAYCDIPNFDDTLKYPPGFTLETDVDAQKNASKVLDMEGDNSGHKGQDVEQESVTKNNTPLNSYKNDTERSTCSGHFKKCDIPRSGESILQLMEELIKVGQTMGYNMEG
ncbi:hypothetical protein Tco_0690562 [Tanacetum coccineum]